MDSQTRQDKQVINIKARFSANTADLFGDSDDEQQWITEAKKGSQTAFYQLYEKYHRRIYALCWRMLADKDSAEDVCQEVFVVLWQKINNFRGESKFSTWLHSVATNVVLGHLRKHKNWIQRVFSIEDQGPNIAEPRVGLTDDSTLTMLDQHISCLPERARLVFVLFAFECNFSSFGNMKRHFR